MITEIIKWLVDLGNNTQNLLVIAGMFALLSLLINAMRYMDPRMVGDMVIPAGFFAVTLKGLSFLWGKILHLWNITGVYVMAFFYLMILLVMIRFYARIYLDEPIIRIRRWL